MSTASRLALEPAVAALLPARVLDEVLDLVLLDLAVRGPETPEGEEPLATVERFPDAADRLRGVRDLVEGTRGLLAPPKAAFGTPPARPPSGARGERGSPPDADEVSEDASPTAAETVRDFLYARIGGGDLALLEALLRARHPPEGQPSPPLPAATREAVLALALQILEVEGENRELLGHLRRDQIDPETGLLGRRPFLREVRRQREKAVGRRDAPLALLRFEITGLGAFLQHVGTAEGRRVLAQVGEVLRASSRAGDLVARLGLQQFALLAPRCSVEAADRVASRIRLRLDRRWRDEETGMARGLRVRFLGARDLSAGEAAEPPRADGEARGVRPPTGPARPERAPRRTDGAKDPSPRSRPSE